MIGEAHTILRKLPPYRKVEQREHARLLGTALKLADHLVTEKPAVVLGAKGGKKTAERGSEYFAKIAAMRKTRAGGRPSNDGK